MKRARHGEPGDLSQGRPIETAEENALGGARGLRRRRTARGRIAHHHARGRSFHRWEVHVQGPGTCAPRRCSSSGPPPSVIRGRAAWDDDGNGATRSRFFLARCVDRERLTARVGAADGCRRLRRGPTARTKHDLALLDADPAQLICARASGSRSRAGRARSALRGRRAPRRGSRSCYAAPRARRPDPTRAQRLRESPHRCPGVGGHPAVARVDLHRLSPRAPGIARQSTMPSRRE
jgi:hypothetical protein